MALGDSFTEGVGDYSARLPNGVRGWADRVAEQLAKADPGWEYANLAIRSKRLRHIIAEQLEPALAMEPTLVTLYAGGNDILDFGTDIHALMKDYEFLVARLAATGATVVLFTGFDVRVSALLEPLKRRNAFTTSGSARWRRGTRPCWWTTGASTRSTIRGCGIRTVCTCPRRATSISPARSWTSSGCRTRSSPKEWEPPAKSGLRDWERRQRRWVHDWVLPLFGRKLRGVTLGDELSPRWPEPVRVPPKAGLKKLAAKVPAG